MEYVLIFNGKLSNNFGNRIKKVLLPLINETDDVYKWFKKNYPQFDIYDIEVNFI